MLKTQTLKTMKMSKKNKDCYAHIMYNKKYDSLTIDEQNTVQSQYAAEKCIFTREDERRIMIEEEYGNSSLPSWVSTLYR